MRDNLIGNRIVSFDGLRGIAAFYVVSYHCFSMLSHGMNYPGQHLLGALFKYGWLGVHLFFIISGFVIAFTLYKYNNINNFIVARFARLYPTYWASLVFSAILTWIMNSYFDLKLYLVNLLMFEGLLHFSNVSGVFWTLAFELTFYVIAAIVFYFNLFSKHKIFVFWGLITLGWQVMNYMGYIHHHSPMSKLGYLLILQYSPLFIFGIYLYKAFSQGSSYAVVFMLLATSIMFIILLPSSTVSGYNVNMCRIFLGFIFLICICAVYFPENNLLSSKCLTFFGRISYSWYLTHLMLAHFIFDLSPYIMKHIYAPYVSFSFSILVAFIFNKLIENPSYCFFMNFFRVGKQKYKEKIEMQVAATEV